MCVCFYLCFYVFDIKYYSYRALFSILFVQIIKKDTDNIVQIVEISFFKKHTKLVNPTSVGKKNIEG